MTRIRDARTGFCDQTIGYEGEISSSSDGKCRDSRAYVLARDLDE